MANRMGKIVPMSEATNQPLLSGTYSIPIYKTAEDDTLGFFIRSEDVIMYRPNPTKVATKYFFYDISKEARVVKEVFPGSESKFMIKLSSFGTQEAFDAAKAKVGGRRKKTMRRRRRKNRTRR